MMRHAGYLLPAVLCSFVACHEPTPPAPETPVYDSHGHALFTNGGFEAGDMSGWTVTPYTNPQVLAVVPPNTWADLRLSSGTEILTSAQQATSANSNGVPAGLTTSETLRFPKFGSWAGVVNQLGNNNRANAISQTVTATAADVDPADGKIHVRFALAPVLQNPGHAPAEQPYFWAQVDNVTKSTTLFHTFNFANQAGVPWQTRGSGSSSIQYTDWQIQDVAPGNAQLAVGDQVKVTVLASGCQPSGHWGEVYVDAFGFFLPGLSVAGSGPQLANNNSEFDYNFLVKNGGVGAASNVVFTENIPANSAYVSYDAPGWSCSTTPSSGTVTKVTCTLGSLNPTASSIVTVRLRATATGTISNGNYTIEATGYSPLIGPLFTTNVTASATYADLGITMTDGKAAVAWGQAVSYTIVVTNAGPSAVTGATVQDTFPGQLQSVSWSCSATGSGSCAAGTGSGNISTTVSLPSGQSATFTVNATLQSGSGSGTLANTATVATPSGTTDPNSNDNTAYDADSIGTLVHLTVNRTGAGTVVSSPAAVNCDSSCSGQTVDFVSGQVVSLTATADSGQSFLGWSGGTCSGTTNPCTFTISGDTTVAADFSSPSKSIASSVSGGHGTLSCPTTAAPGSSPQCTVSPDNGYELATLVDNGTNVASQVSAGVYTIVAISVDHTLVATFAKSRGTACGGNTECNSGFCADGVCCDGACSGQCEACNEAGSAGTCSAVTGAPRSSRTACTSDSSTCGGACDGTLRTACTYPGASTQCRAASCSGGTATDPTQCAGTGSCAGAVTRSCGSFACGATDCKSTCGGDGDCASTAWCDSGTCVPKKAPASACTADNQCGTAHCVDGVCCDSACSGQCQACDVSGSVGTCSPATGAPHGTRTACASDNSSCAGACDGTNTSACAYPGASTACRSASCQAGTETLAASCAGTGSCPAVQQNACGTYACGATACRTGCAGDTECAATAWCDSGVCAPKKIPGAVCTAANQCASGFCTDGVCCDKACNGQCEACAETGSAGTCKSVTGAPRGQRTACDSDGSSCAGACDGTNAAACAYPGVSTQCRAPSCAAGTATDETKCAGTGNCAAAVTRNCGHFACGATDCRTTCSSDSDCAATAWCSAGTCVAKKIPGDACGAANQCASGFCTDGVCCNAACAGQCQACDVAGSVGTCSPVLGAPHGARTACVSDGSSCGGACDGANIVACALPAGETLCRAASCTDGTQTLAAHCAGNGACPAVQRGDCGAYSCGTVACNTQCDADEDCANGYFCEENICKPQHPDGTACTADNTCASGNCVDGFCCNTTCRGQCEACDLAGQQGTCLAATGAPHGTVRDACVGDGSSCSGACDGTLRDACVYAGATTSCRAPTCAAGLATAAAQCDGSGRCPAAVTARCAPWGCGATACRTHCTTSSECDASAFCAGGLCLTRYPDGTECQGDIQCDHGHCTDGVCCNRACAGQCEACNVAGSAGTCTAVAGAPRGARPACGADGSVCGGTCDGIDGASCAYPGATTACRDASCAGGSETLAAKCTGLGACGALQQRSCGAYACGAAACETECTSDAQCAAGRHCQDGACETRREPGAACTASNQCASGHCTDGVCCDRACDGQCEACDTAASKGTCTAVTGAPHGARAACLGDGSACSGACDGTTAAACEYPDSGTGCRAASCTNGSETLAASCAGTGMCPAAQTQSCGGYACGAAACRTACEADSDCASGSFCAGDGTCSGKKTPGETCGADGECASGHCTDGVCCDVACQGQCQACDAEGSVGTCTTVTGAPHGSRRACTSDGSVCAGACDGENALACAFPGAATSCREPSCAEGVATLAAACDGAGTCPGVQTQECGRFVCGATVCNGDCTVDADCAADSFCSGGVCRRRIPDGVVCGADAQCASGHCVDGLCCNTACDGQCEACDEPGHAGTCSAIAGAPHGARTSCATDASACAGVCDGLHGAACTYPGEETSCRSAGCTDGVATLAAACNHTGSCPAEQTQSCEAYACGGTACLGDCRTDADCAAGNFCSAGVCRRKLADATTCASSAQCESGHCVDGLCCDTACGGACEACDTAGHPGRCSPVRGAPHGARPACASDGTQCGGACDGVHAAACTYPAAEVACRPGSCTGGTATLGASCNGAGRCPALQTQGCGRFACGPEGCRGDCARDEDCAAGSFCAGGLCRLKGPNGVQCAGANQCASGQCVDGHCCERACRGQCEACDVAGRLGTCQPVFGPPHGTRTPCVDDLSACGGSCDGTHADTCAYPGSEAQCRPARCAGGVATASADCNGSGRCPDVVSQQCGTFGCEDTQCRTACKEDKDCATGAYCLAGVCYPSGDTSTWQARGTGCASTGGGSAWALAALAAAALFLRLRRRTALFAAAALAAAPASAETVSTAFDVERFQPGSGSEDILGVHSALVPVGLGWSASLYASYADRPLRLIATDKSGTEIPIVGSMTTGYLLASVGFLDRFEFGLAVPIALHQSFTGVSAIDPSLGLPSAGGGLSDLRVGLKARLVEIDRLHLAASIPVTIPTGKGLNFLGNSSLTATPEIEAEWVADSGTRLAGNLGMLLRGSHKLFDLSVGNALTYGVGGVMPFAVSDQKLEAMATLVGEAGFEDTGSAELPLELMLAVRWKLPAGLALTVGGGPGLTNGFGTPRYRVFGGLSWIPARSVTEPLQARDVEAEVTAGEEVAVEVLPSGEDAVPGVRVATVAPPRTGAVGIGPDGRVRYRAAMTFAGTESFRYAIADPRDRTASAVMTVHVKPAPPPEPKPEPVPVPEPQTPAECPAAPPPQECPAVAEGPEKPADPCSKCGTHEPAQCPDLDDDEDGVANKADRCPKDAGLASNEGCPLPDRDKDGVADVRDDCPDEAGPEDNNGCPTKDRDIDGIADRMDNCPDMPGPASNAGCPVEQKQQVRIEREKVTRFVTRLRLLAAVNFDTGEATIQKESYPLLQNVVDVLKSHKDMQHLRIEGHTDNRGGVTANRKLSDARAKSVEKWLKKHGMRVARVVTAGYGQDRPLDDRTNEQALAKNRRVEITVLDEAVEK